MNPDENIEEIKPDFFIKKTRKGKWKQIYPVQKDLTKPHSIIPPRNLHWKRFLFSSTENLIMLIIALTILIFLTWSYIHDTEGCRDVMGMNPNDFCEKWTIQYGDNDSNLNDFEEIDMDTKKLLYTFNGGNEEVSG